MARFAPATMDEQTVYGASAPGFADRPSREDPAVVEEWIAEMQDNGIERVCCLLSDEQLARYDDLLGRYREAFGADRVLHAPVPDHHLMDEATLTEAVLPFFRAAEAADERVVAHCLAGIGRTGQALAAWLVHARGRSPGEAIPLVEEMSRQPRDAVHMGNATERELTALLEAAER